jgi:hypothetical protein
MALSHATYTGDADAKWSVHRYDLLKSIQQNTLTAEDAEDAEEKQEQRSKLQL